MTTEPPGRKGCASAETLAAYIDGTLGATERTRVEAHLADCEQCREAIVETMSALTELNAGVAPVGRRGLSRWGLAAAAAVLATAAAVALIVGLPRGWGRLTGHADWPELAELIASAADERPFDGRLSGFPWATVRAASRSATSEPILSPAIAIAAAHAEQAVAKERNTQTLSAFGAAEAVRGRLDDSVRAFEECTAVDPRSASCWSDLSATLLARSHVPGHEDDAARALEAANTALQDNPRLSEALFNKALALERSSLTDQAVAAWEQYLSLDSSSPWADEARRHLADLRKPKAPVADAQADRERLFDEVLPNWASAAARRDRGADAVLGEARDLARVIGSRSSDSLAADAIAAIDRARATDRTALVDGHHLYGVGRAEYRGGRYAAAREQLLRAAALLERGRSPAAALARLYVASSTYQLGEARAAGAQLERLDAQLAARSAQYDSIDGRLAWVLALVQLSAGHHNGAEQQYTRARDAFVRSAEPGNVGMIESLIAEHFDSLEEPARAWSHQLASLEAARRSGVFVSAARSARETGWLTVAEAFLRQAVAMARETRRPIELGDALRAQALVEGRLHDYAAAEKALRESRSALENGSTLSARVRAELDATAALIADPARPRGGIESATKALDYFHQAHLDARLPELYLARARLTRASDLDAARRDLASGLSALDAQRSSVHDDVSRATFSDQLRRLSDELVELELAAGRHDAAFAAAERGRSWPATAPVAESAAISPAVLQNLLAEGATVAYFQLTENGCHVWTFNRQSSTWTSCALARPEVGRFVAAFASDLERPAVGRALTDGLLAPTLRGLPDGAPLIIIPDGPLDLLPFAALPGLRKGFLIEEHPLLIAPGATWLADASRRAAAFPSRPSDIVAFGHPSVDPNQFPGLADLPNSATEANAVVEPYDRARSRVVLDADVTSATFIDALRQPTVVHFAGHTIVDARNPGRSVVAITDPSGAGLTMASLAALPGVKSRLVVLSSCQGVAGWLSESEGPLGLARALLKAGVPTVVASQWRVDDRAARELLVRFHIEYAVSGDEVGALRSAQLSLLRSEDLSLRDPTKWAGFVVIGGSARLVHVVN